MKTLLNKIISGVLIGSMIFSPTKSQELEDKVLMKKSQSNKIVVYNREINENIMTYSFVENHQKKIYETSNNIQNYNERNIAYQLLEKGSSGDLEDKTNTLIELSRDKNNFTFTYKNTGRKDLSEIEKRRIPNSEEFFREDTKNCYIYFVYPPTSEIDILSQELEILNNRTEQTRKINTKKYEDTQAYNILSKVNDILSFYEEAIPIIEETQNSKDYKINNLGYSQETEYSSSLEKLLFNYLSEENPQVRLAKKIPGKFGRILKGTIFLSEVLINEIEKQNRLKFWEQGLSREWKIKEMPYYIGEKRNSFQDNIISRKTSFNLEGKCNKFYIVISTLPYITGTFTTRTSGIEDILIEIER